MREIKFRAWGPSAYGKNTMTEFDFSDFDADLFIPTCVYIDDLVIMQYTGLKDDNGKKIFEGDILEFEHEREDTHGNDVLSYSREVVKFDTGSFILSETGELLADSPYFDVIGNIYENPELLEKSNDIQRRFNRTD